MASSVSDWGPEEHVSDLGIKLQPGTPLYEVAVDDLRPTQLCVGMQQVREGAARQQRSKATAGCDPTRSDCLMLAGA